MPQPGTGNFARYVPRVFTVAVAGRRVARVLRHLQRPDPKLFSSRTGCNAPPTGFFSSFVGVPLGCLLAGTVSDVPSPSVCAWAAC
eukprot:356457-Chlamydomonas_euryale.AAC.5